MMTRVYGSRRRSASVIAAVVVTALMQLTNAPLAAQDVSWVTPRAERTSDAVIARDLAKFDSLAAATTSARSAALFALARDAYERNDAGPLTARILNMSSRRAGDAQTRAVRGELWALLDSLDTRVGVTNAQRAQSVALEVALLRAGSPLLGAPSCAAWEQQAMTIAAGLRVITPVAPVVTPPPAMAPAVLRGVPSLVHFALDKHALATASRRVLDALVDSLRPFGDVQISLEGHTDVRASVSYNQALSSRRVEAVREYLESKGISASRIRAVALGESNLDNAGTGVVDHARNRRVVLRYFTPDGREIVAVLQLDDLQVERP